MSQITLVRHGQANSNARTEDDYDRLSELGHQQAAWLGDYFQTSGERFARVYSGTLRRHVETAHSMGIDADPAQDPRLNELAYFTMAQAMEAQHGVPIPNDREEFLTHLPLMFRTWQEDRLSDIPETFATFETRVRAALTEIADGHGPALVVTSGGLIGMAMRVTMGLDLQATAHACLAIQNTSVHRWTRLPEGLALTQFNALPHLDTIERRHAQTHL